MKVIRTICPHCGTEIDIQRLDIKNTREYSEEIVTKTCDDCKDSPEAKLIDAIFGRKADAR